MSNLKLTVKQENFCNYYLESGNASDAYRRAYSCKKMSYKTINENACRILKKSNIAARVAELQEKQRKKSDITKEMVLSELAKIGFSSIANLHNTWITRKELEDLTEEQKSSIKSISTKVLKKNIGTSDSPEIVDVEYVKIELYDKIKALENINKMLGFEAPVKAENTTSVRMIIGDENASNI